MTGADLYGANLHGAIFSPDKNQDCNSPSAKGVTKVNLSGTNLRGVDLSETQLDKDIINITYKRVALYDDQTKLPESLEKK
ncbi:hypothetical protein RintRC_4515 [Richelia intracellularis]|nr:hypothetical protein RintRC_4515 [Richelia intracellularis]